MKKKAMPAIVTTAEEFPNMVVMAVDARVAAFILRCVGATSCGDVLTESLYQALSDEEHIIPIYEHLGIQGMAPNWDTAKNLAKELSGTEWEVGE